MKILIENYQNNIIKDLHNQKIMLIFTTSNKPIKNPKIMRTEFNKLVEVMQMFELYQSDDQVGFALNKLSNKITELEKRIECAVRSAKEINQHVWKYTDDVDNHIPINISVDDHDFIINRSNDIDIALDMCDDMCVVDNWYGLFEPTEDKVELSSGGIPYRSCYHCSIKEEETVMGQVNGFWLCCDCNDETKEEESVFELDTTKFLPSTFDKVKQVIEILKTIDNGSCIDGETMDYIVKELGFEEYLLRSLVMKSSYKDTKDLLREKFEISI